jgi:hypothetical protein
MAASRSKRSADPVPAGHLTIWDLLADELANVPKPRPEGYVTVAELAARKSVTYERAGQILRQKYLLGQLDRARIKSEAGRSMYCYGPKR